MRWRIARRYSKGSISLLVRPCCRQMYPAYRFHRDMLRSGPGIRRRVIEILTELRESCSVGVDEEILRIGYGEIPEMMDVARAVHGLKGRSTKIFRDRLESGKRWKEEISCGNVASLCNVNGSQEDNVRSMIFD